MSLQVQAPFSHTHPGLHSHQSLPSCDSLRSPEQTLHPQEYPWCHIFHQFILCTSQTIKRITVGQIGFKPCSSIRAIAPPRYAVAINEPIMRVGRQMRVITIIRFITAKAFLNISRLKLERRAIVCGEPLRRQTADPANAAITRAKNKVWTMCIFFLCIYFY